MTLDAIEIVYEAIDELNARAESDDEKIAKTPDTALFGLGGLDSLDLVNLVVAVEEKFEERTGEVIILVDEETMAMTDSPFRTVATLAAFLQKSVPTDG